MSRKNKKPKKVSAKKLKYAAFHKEKPSVLNIASRELTAEEQKGAQEDDLRITAFLKQKKNAPTKEVSERRMRSKR
jgi:hypothetical protein